MPGSSARRQEYTIEDYVRLERFSNVKHEFVDGQVYAMGGGSPEHGRYAANVIRLLATHLLERPCQVHTSDVRVRVVATGLDTYPDVSVVCDRIERDEDDPLAITNPMLLVEVLSPSTEAYDRGEKLAHYKQIPSLREILSVAFDRPQVEAVRREGDSWATATAGAGETLHVASIGYDLEVDDVFRDPLARPDG